MGASVLPPAVKLFVVTIHRDTDILQSAISNLTAAWGEIDWTSEDYGFDVTNYYEAEMGQNLLRRLYSFNSLIQPEQIADCKEFANQIESKYSTAGKRTINLDPGYLDTYKVVLASTKYGGQKIHLRDGIYADMTLVMYKGKWQSFEWGFPDFKSGRYDSALSTIRNLYKSQTKK